LRLAIRDLIDRNLLASACYRERTGSTSSDALAELQASDVDASSMPRLHLADVQTAGRGRQGNTWQTSEDALTFSVVLPFDRQAPAASLLSIAVGVAVAEAIEFICAPASVGLKWPNDICVPTEPASHRTSHRTSHRASHRAAGAVGSRGSQLRKLGGILIEATGGVSEAVVVGIGLNVNSAPPADQLDARVAPMSLAVLAGRSLSRGELVTAVVESMVETLGRANEDPGGVADDYRKRCLLTGRELALRQADQKIVGRCEGIDDDGSLRIRVGNSLHRLRSGEVHSIRPA
jgi:BirA family biotin operon repressor/biotin-[acetyl-CoA-carboxylase] ligase